MILKQLAEMRCKMPTTMLVCEVCREPFRPSRTDPLYGLSAALHAPDGPARALLAARAQV